MSDSGGLLLVLSAGHADVQLVTEDSRQRFNSDSCGLEHDKIERGGYTLADAPEGEGSGNGSVPERATVTLCTPKLDAVLSYLGDKPINHVLLFETRRPRPSDPRMAGRIMKRRLQERCCLKDEQFTLACYVQEDMDFEDRSKPGEAVLRAELVKAIADATRKVLAQPYSSICLAPTGGPKGIIRLIDEVVLLHAGRAAVELVEAPEGNRKAPSSRKAVSRTLVQEPSESFRARRIALHLLEAGNLLGAWGAVKHLHEFDSEKNWTSVLEWLYLFAASLPQADSCNLQSLAGLPPAASAAMRVEFALRSGDIPRAVHGTVAFYEAALWDFLQNFIEEKDSSRRCYRMNKEPAPSLVRTEQGEEKENRKRPFELVQKDDNGSKWYFVHDGPAPEGKLAKHYLNNPELGRLGAAIDGDIRRLRNDVAHCVPTPELMQGAEELMKTKGLWSTTRTFLETPLVGDVLSRQGIDAHRTLCTRLLEEVRSRLLSC